MKRKVAFLLAASTLAPFGARAQSPLPGIPGLPDITCTVPNGGPVGTVQQLDAPFALALASAGGTTVCLNLSGFINRVGDGKMFQLGGPDGVSVDIGGLGSAVVTGLFNPDPFISFGATTTNIVAGPVTYAFFYGTPIVPGFYNTATSTGGVSVTNGVEVPGPNSTTSVTTSAIYPTFISGYGTNGVAVTNLGVDIGVTPCTAGPAVPLTDTEVCAYGPGNNTFPLAFYDNLEALLTYTQDDVASVAAWTGAVTLDINRNLVPEPSSIVLVLSGVLAIAGAGAARRRTR